MPDHRSRLHEALAHRYRLERELGRGGMATVWLAHDLRYGRRVALKVLHPELASSIGSERFLREIAISASLAHPHILPLHESGEADGFLYYVMPYVDGESLRERLSREIQLPVEEAVRIAREVADALAYAHGRGIVHRDIKPENILLEAGHAVVADFGVARAIQTAGGERLTSTGLAVGTPAYMSPEQAGAAERLDGRSDIYSLGCVLYEMLAGEPPFTGPTPQALAAKHLNATPPQVRVTRATVPPQVERVIERALAKVPADRFGTAQELASALTSTPHAPPKAGAASIGLATRLVLAAIVVLAVTVPFWRSGKAAGGRLRANRVVVFPLNEHRKSTSLGEAEAVATYIGYALDGSEPLKWIDASDVLSGEERSGDREFSPDVASEIARRVDARYYIDGSIVPLGDSVAVVLRLRDVVGDSLVKRAGAAAPTGTANLPRLGLQAVAQLLPSLLEPGRSLDLSSLADRHPAAIAAFLQGEREYRRMQFQDALEHYESALRADSALVVAAMKGAQAAHWKELPEVAERLNRLAQERVNSVPLRYAEFIRGLHFYLRGDADSALWHFDLALRQDSLWVEAWMAKAEVFYHLLPQQSPPDSLAKAAFLTVERLDSTFAPPLLHLAQLSIREGNRVRAAALVQRLRALHADTAFLLSLELMDGCLQGEERAESWPGAVARNSAVALSAARYLVHGATSACGKTGLRALLRGEHVPANQRWGAMLTLAAVLSSEGRTSEVRQLLDSPAAKSFGADMLYLPLAAQDSGFQSSARVVVTRLGTNYRTMPSPFLWALGHWAVWTRDTASLAAIGSVFSDRKDAAPNRMDSLMSSAFAAHLALAQGDTGRAIRQLFALRPSAPGGELEWQPWESLGFERVVLSQLLLNRGNPAHAIEVAAQIESPQPVIYAAYLPASLRVRMLAARSLGLSDQADTYRRRLQRLRFVSIEEGGTRGRLTLGGAHAGHARNTDSYLQGSRGPAQPEVQAARSAEETQPRKAPQGS